MNKISLEQENLFNMFFEYDFLIGMGSLGLSFLGTALRDFIKVENLSENILSEYDRIIQIRNDKYIYFIQDDGNEIGGLSDEKLINTLECLFKKAKKMKIESIAMNLEKPDTNSSNLQFLCEYKKIYRVYPVLDFINYITRKLKIDNMNICLCDLSDIFLRLDYKPVIINENNVFTKKDCSKKYFGFHKINFAWIN
jgi:hypothetical protein